MIYSPRAAPSVNRSHIPSLPQNNPYISMEMLTLINILFGIFNDNEDFAILNHLILVAKYFIYKCKLNKTKPTLRVFIEKIKLVYHVERKIYGGIVSGQPTE